MKRTVELDAFDRLTLLLDEARAVVNAVIQTEESLPHGDMVTLFHVIQKMLDEAAKAAKGGL